MNELKLFIFELDLPSKLSPWRNRSIAWFYIFFPTLIAYFVMMSNHLNSKPIIGEFEKINRKAFSKIIPQYAQIEVIAEGMKWSEGPIWVDDKVLGVGYLLFSDTVNNKIYKWEEGKGLFTVGKTTYLDQSGCLDGDNSCLDRAEIGSNGLLRHSFDHGISDTKEIDLFACQHGNRALSYLMANGTRTWIATHYQGKRLNSPNDLVLSEDGHIYFTDPPYGLIVSGKIPGVPSKDENDNGIGVCSGIDLKLKEIDFNGVYLLHRDDVIRSLTTRRPTSRLTLLVNDLKRPNGLAFSPDYSKLYISNSDPNYPVIMEYEILEDGNGNIKEDSGRILFDARNYKDFKESIDKGEIGMLDGMKVDIFGNLFVAGMDSVLILSPSGDLIGRIIPGHGRKVSNVAFGGNNKLYMTSGDLVLRTSIITKPAVKMA
jgi:gluconolactonase